MCGPARRAADLTARRWRPPPFGSRQLSPGASSPLAGGGSLLKNTPARPGGGLRLPLVARRHGHPARQPRRLGPPPPTAGARGRHSAELNGGGGAWVWGASLGPPVGPDRRLLTPVVGSRPSTLRSSARPPAVEAQDTGTAPPLSALRRVGRLPLQGHSTQPRFAQAPARVVLGVSRCPHFPPSSPPRAASPTPCRVARAAIAISFSPPLPPSPHRRHSVASPPSPSSARLLPRVHHRRHHEQARGGH